MSKTENVELTVLCLIEDGDQNKYTYGEQRQMI